VVDNETKDVVAHFPYEEGALVTAVDGSHAGEIGTVAEITVTPGSGNNIVRVESDGGEFETVEQYVVVIDENFTGDDDADVDDADPEPDADSGADAAPEDGDDGGEDE
jgi:small subunit ribosomal protein S4e